MSEFPVATTPSPGIMGVDWEHRVDFNRLREYRLDRARGQMEEDDLGALLLFETSNIRYVTSTQIGYWAFNKGERWALLTRKSRPRIWDFGSAVSVTLRLASHDDAPRRRSLAFRSRQDTENVFGCEHVVASTFQIVFVGRRHRSRHSFSLIRLRRISRYNPAP